MTTKSKQVTVNQWVLTNKETGKVYSNWTYPSRNAARKAAKGKRFKGMYTATRSGDGGIDPKKLKKGKPAPTPKSLNFEQEISYIYDLIGDILDIVIDDEVMAVVEPELLETFHIQEPVTIKESNTMSTRKPVNTKPKLRSRSSAPGAKFHRHGTFGVK